MPIERKKLRASPCEVAQTFVIDEVGLEYDSCCHRFFLQGNLLLHRGSGFSRRPGAQREILDDLCGALFHLVGGMALTMDGEHVAEEGQAECGLPHTDHLLGEGLVI